MAGGRNYVKKTDVEKAYGHATSICWSCARAYALPDPAGCGWHRREHEQVWDEAATKYTNNGGANPYPVHSVTVCKFYERSAPRMSEKDISDLFNSDAGNLIMDIEMSNNELIDVAEELILFREFLKERHPDRVKRIGVGCRD